MVLIHILTIICVGIVTRECWTPSHYGARAIASSAAIFGVLVLILTLLFAVGRVQSLAPYACWFSALTGLSLARAARARALTGGA
ncbi:MAG: hypothetical protein Q7S96_02110 [bacterium]|nr:hypothetical protein [bacterium]